jgi:hypothetical protein
MPNALVPRDAEHPNVLHALIRKRQEIAGKIEHNQLTLRHLTAELDHVEATIRIFHPEVDVGDIGTRPVPPAHAAFKGEIARIVRRSLANAKSPLTSRDIAANVVRERGLNPDDKMLTSLMVRRVGACLGTQKRKGFARLDGMKDGLQGWVWVHR